MENTTPLKTIKSIVFDEHIFKTLKQAQNWIRKNETPDYIVIDNILYTMENYDLGGQEIRYYNKRTGKMLTVKNENRYKLGFGDSELSIEETDYYREDIDYAD